MTLPCRPPAFSYTLPLHGSHKPDSLQHLRRSWPGSAERYVILAGPVTIYSLLCIPWVDLLPLLRRC